MAAIPPMPQDQGLPDVLAALDDALAVAELERPALGGPRRLCDGAEGPDVARLPFPRTTIILAGRKRHDLSSAGRPLRFDGRPGGVVHFASGAYDRSLWREPCRFLGVVYRRDFLRVLRFDHPGGPRPAGPARCAHHTRHPLAGPALQILAALDGLADRADGGDPRQAGALLRVVLALAREHVAADLAGSAGGGSLFTWQLCREFIEERLAEALSRTRVARAVGVHPNYLSALCSRHGGASFQRTVEALRLDRAKAQLREDPALPLAEVARRCGWADVGHFIKVFRRRCGATPGRWRRLDA
jgi:AraC-like DNA-binding protein